MKDAVSASDRLGSEDYAGMYSYIEILYVLLHDSILKVRQKREKWDQKTYAEKELVSIYDGLEDGE